MSACRICVGPSSLFFKINMWRQNVGFCGFGLDFTTQVPVQFCCVGLDVRDLPGLT